MLLEKGIYVLDVDVRATWEAYERLPLPEDGCGEYRNYIAATPYAEAEVRAFLDSLGVDIRKPAEMAAFPAAERNTVQYGGIYLVSGRILRGAPRDNNTIYDDAFSLLVGDSAVSFQPEPDPSIFGSPAMRLELFQRLPWVLGERGGGMSSF